MLTKEKGKPIENGDGRDETGLIIYQDSTKKVSQEHMVHLANTKASRLVTNGNVKAEFTR